MTTHCPTRKMAMPRADPAGESRPADDTHGERVGVDFHARRGSA